MVKKWISVIVKTTSTEKKHRNKPDVFLYFILSKITEEPSDFCATELNTNGNGSQKSTKRRFK